MTKHKGENAKQGESLLGIFDSGVGGFSVYKKIKSRTQANCIYYGDCLRAPYGNRDESEIVEFIKDDIRFLQDEGVTHFVNACNSMSVMTTHELLKDCGVDESVYIDMVRAFKKHTTSKEGDRVLVLATHATIRSGAYQNMLEEHGVEVYTYAYTDLAQAIENNATEDELSKMLCGGMEYAKAVGVTHILYGCTHYPLIHHIFKGVAQDVGFEGEFLDPAVYVAEEVKSWGIHGERKFTPYSSKDTPAFIKHVIACLS